jgi:pyruvate-formate lyase-activating enzyme
VYKNRYSISLNNIIERLQENDIHVILFTYPHHRYYLENVPEDDKEEFLEIINNARNKYDITVKFFHQEYSDKENWSDLIHIFYNYKLEENNEDSIQYSNDIADLILNEIKENVI